MGRQSVYSAVHGAYEHFYDTSDVADSDSKHYLANSFVIDTDMRIADLGIDAQYGDVRTFQPTNLPADLQRYTVAYLCDADTVPYDEHL
jgi:colanic acid biosynthesis protein WcaH